MHFSVVLGGLAVGLLNFGDKVLPTVPLPSPPLLSLMYCTLYSPALQDLWRRLHVHRHGHDVVLARPIPPAGGRDS